LYLKKLEIQGFKSFADKTVLEFGSGITAVVGPNGSGKSNIADAVRWVLGEQSAKTLRGNKMEDVIFAGTEHRKPLGFAEVSLTIDNSDNSLPVEFSEVTITRRAFRSGESEYMINKTSCRLKDIHELFLDTGIGKDGYSIIGQGRIDEILSAKSEDRRHIFEEASGIMKFKTRKIEAEKKLELTKQNLLRINDIIIELENQLVPLKEQAEIARKYLALREKLKELEVNVYLENISKYRDKIKELEEQYSSIKENMDSENKKLEDITRANSRKKELLRSLEEKLNSSRQEFYNLEGSLERFQSEIRLNEEKINNLMRNIGRIDGEILEIENKICGLSRELDGKRQKLDYLGKMHTEYSQKLAESEKRMETVLASLDESERHIESLKSSVMDKLDLLSDKKTQVNSIKSHLEGFARRQHHIGDEINQLLLEKDREKLRKEELQESLRAAKEQIKDLKSELEALTKEKSDMDSRLEELRKRQNKLKSEIQFKSSRQKMLGDMEKNLEGYNRSVRAVLEACHGSAAFGAGIHGALAQLIKVEKRFETAVEMALGGALQNIVTDTEEDARRAIEFLKSNKLGRATFLPISAVKGRQLDENVVNRVKNYPGFCGIASELVSCGEEFKGIILNLLGKVVVVENLEAGIRLARDFKYGFRIVTIEGDVINTGGSMTGGSAESKGTGILSRRREILELKADIDRLSGDEASLEKDIDQLISRINEAAQRITSKEAQIKDKELARVRDESHLMQVEENIERLAAKIEMLRQDRDQLSRQQKDVEKELEKYLNELRLIENEISEIKGVIEEHQQKHKEDRSVRDALHADITDFKISVNSILESMEGVKEAISRIENEIGALRKNIGKKVAEKDKCDKEIKELQETNEDLSRQIKAGEQEKAGKVFEIDRITEEKKVLEEELHDIVNQINEINRNIVLLNEEFSRVEVRKAKIESEMEAVQNRMWDEYELTYTNALDLKKDIGSIAQAQKKIAEYRNQIKELGHVNIGAIEDYIKTRERYEFMVHQRDDMEQAKEKLHRVIREMTSIMKKQFLEQFNLINHNFNLVFRELFDGGKAELILVDEENVLESGIEIEVQPPGKKLQNMMLLSGGERAFTAIALLFAILRLRPVPFCILDEIEAALDDANVYRFSEYLRKFSGQTQFIMVTHRKGTIENSDALYGVTMQERGISKVISMKLGEKAG